MPPRNRERYGRNSHLSVPARPKPDRVAERPGGQSEGPAERLERPSSLRNGAEARHASGGDWATAKIPYLVMETESGPRHAPDCRLGRSSPCERRECRARIDGEPAGIAKPWLRDGCRAERKPL